MKVKDLMATNVKSCAAYNTPNTAAQTMWDNDIGCVPIVDNDRRVLGMLTDRDVCMAAYILGVPLTGSLVTSAISKPVFSCAPDDDIASAEKLMREKAGPASGGNRRAGAPGRHHLAQRYRP